MKKIEAIIRRNKLGALKEELAKFGVSGITVMEAGGFGHQRGHRVNEEELYDEVYLVPKYKIEIVVKNEDYSKIIEVIRKVCYTGHPGDGKIFVSNIEEAFKIRTSETGENAL